MKRFLFLIISFFTILNASAQGNCDPVKFKQLLLLSKKSAITPDEFSSTLSIVKELELTRCAEYSVKTSAKNDSVVSTLTEVFGDICLTCNNQNAVKEYVNYLCKHKGSAEEELSLQFEKLFVQQPEYVLTTIGFDKDLLNHLEWGFINNHYENSKSNKPRLNSNNYRTIFYQINPKVKEIYPKYKKQIDYLLRQISSELRG
ncbi:MAG: hypothetical protein ACXVAY_08170 [Mucilaginibacter sp.]